MAAPDQESADVSESRQPVWRLAEFYLIVPWPIAFPEDRGFVKSRSERLDWLPFPLEALAALLPQGLIDQVQNVGDHSFTVFSFVRYPIEFVSPPERFLAVNKLVEYATYPPEVRPLLPNPIHGEQSNTRIETYETIIVAATCLFEEQNNIQRAFDRCLEDLAIFMEGYLQTSGDLRANFVTRATIYPMVPALLFDPITGQKGTTVIQAGNNFPLQPPAPPELTLKQLDELNIRLEFALRGEPYSQIRQWQRVAYRTFYLDGDYAATVVAAHTAGEVYFDALLLRMAWEEIEFGHPNAPTPEEVVKWFSPPNTLRTRLGAQYHPRIEGRWDPGQPGNPIHTWINTVSKLRNRVVHGGYRPTEQEAESALASLAETEQFVEDLVAKSANVRKHPFSTFMMLGPVGLERFGVYSKKIREKIEGAPSGWQLAFYEFRRSIIENLS